MERAQVVKEVLVEESNQQEVAKSHKISTTIVSMLVKKTIQDHGFLRLHREAAEILQEADDTISQVALRMQDNGEIIEKAAKVQSAVKEEHGLEVTLRQVRTVLKKDLGLLYGRVALVPKNANSERRLVLRQQYAL